MKKYKLIKEYPSLCKTIKEGDIFTKKENGNCYYSKNLSHFVYDYEVENNPQYWEEVVEKDYKILSFKQNSLITDLWEAVDISYDKFARKCGQVFCTTPYTLEQILNNSLYSIHSVKRLS